MNLVTPHARTDLTDFWRLSGVLRYKKLPHTPFLAFIEDAEVIVCREYDNITKLLALPDDTPVLCQWQGQWRSDFFRFTVGDARVAHAEQEKE